MKDLFDWIFIMVVFKAGQVSFDPLTYFKKIALTVFHINMELILECSSEI